MIVCLFVERARAANELDEFEKQHLWPLDKQNFDKLGILVCAFAYLIFCGLPLVEAIKLLISK